MSLPQLPSSIRLVEVGLRDGLQSVVEPVPTGDKVELVHMLIDAGVREIEAVSFAHPRVLPQLADASEVMAAVPRLPGVVYRGLAPNLRGAQRAADCGLDELVVVVSADTEVSIRNQGMNVDEVLADLAKIGELTQSVGTRLVVAVACAFFAPARGPVSKEERLRVVEAAIEAGASGVYLAATSGEEHPGEIYDGVAQVCQDYPELDVGVHLHNRNGFAPANALASMMAGASWLEGSFGGLGGDMWFPGDPAVLGNAALEDLIHLCDGLGIATGIDLEKYMKVSDRIAELTGRPSASFVSRGGTRNDLAAARWPENN
ncbi:MULTISPECIES: hydroxymethylglutaryl-CoA lyase [Arthrobacter]|uniref:Pyruvate carboxyltransferase n=1 Tax=Arthrobacter psychrochitiniphilus TaxID=291045 RepID=A0A2V3DP42_9MICC|nr:hydroxymethylglutaryl-CoA lyase [Arthrobacter psychrochitiniphilus]NYG17898.1 hydroxymethylglutaryl-CoA lyase [Arthrobacter psychrochitiniphilus]PXA64106.1 pyruvate carboxyltransferase [Arthrobacter psychrochitiniphilus]